MASGLVSAFGGDSSNGGEERKPNPIAKFEVSVADDSKGAPTLRLLAKRADGTGSKYQNLILWLDTPDALRALRAALPTLSKALDAVEAKQVSLGNWQAASTPAAPKAAAPEAPAAPPKSKLASAFDDLPW